MENKWKEPSVILSFIPILVLLGLLITNVMIFKDSATSGPNQLALGIAAAVTTALGFFFLKMPYSYIEDTIFSSIGRAMQANIILLVVGSLIGLWIISGIVPAMIYYGLKIINPTFFLPVACIVCAFVSIATGSSWSTAGTVGLALIGIGKALNIPIGPVAGAIISGAYFGDKMSPLSDTTNLAPAMAGTDLFTHIRHMVYTTGPAIILAVILFFILGFFYQGQGAASTGDVAVIIEKLDEIFAIGPHLFIVPGVVLFMVIKKTPALPALVIGTFLGGVFALLFQQELLSNLSKDGMNYYSLLIKTAFGGFSIESGNAALDSLLSRGGMAQMLNTVWLIIMAMIFGGTLEATGMLHKIAQTILRFVFGVGSLVAATLGSAIVLNMTACDQYLAIVVPGRMFKEAYDDYGLHPKNLSRALEDSGTVTSVLVPWNTCGAYFSGVLGVSTLVYLPFCFFNMLSPMVSATLAFSGITMDKKETPPEVE